MAATPGPLRLLLDTNVVVAALLWSGPPRRLMELAFEGAAVELFTSQALLDELRQTLGYPRLAPRLAHHATSVDELMAHYTALVSLVTPAAVPRIVAGDADDDQVIAAALAAQADLLVTGDRKHLLPLGSHQGIEIISPADALQRIAL